jgi:CHAD domain-containing protein
MAERSHFTHREHLLAYIHKQAERCTDNLGAAVAKGDVEAVHDLRVASRRLNVPMRILRDWVGRKQVAKVMRRLRRVRRAFRRVRDLDVVQASLCKVETAERLEASDLAQLEGLLTQRRNRALERSQRRIAKTRATQALHAIDTLCAGFGKSSDDDAELLIHQEVERHVDRWSKRLMEHDPRSPEATDLHQTRLCVKRLRYAAELLRDMEDRTDDPLIAALVEAQEQLGQWNDDLVAAAMISAIARRAPLLTTQPGFSSRLLRYAAARAAGAQARRAAIMEKWPAIHGLLSARCEADIGKDTASHLPESSLGLT